MDQRPDENNAYGLYPVQCRNVLIEERGDYVSDAGIYVGQSDRSPSDPGGVQRRRHRDREQHQRRGRVRRHEQHRWDPRLRLPLQVVNGGEVLVRRNEVFGNNHPNRAEGNIVGTVPPGTAS